MSIHADRISLPLPSTTALGSAVASVIVLAAALYFGQTAPPNVLLALAASAGLLLTLQSPQAALPALPPIAVFVSSGLGTGTGTTLNAAVLLVVALLLIGLLSAVVRGRAWEPLPPAALPLIALNVVVVLSLLTGAEPLLPLARTAPPSTQLGGAAVFLLSTGALLLGYYAFRGTTWLKLFTYIFIITGGIFCIVRFSYPPLIVTRLVGPGGEGSLFWTWLVVIAFSQGAFNTELPKLFRTASLMVAGAAVYIGLVLQRDWTSGWLPAVIALAVAISMRSFRAAFVLFVGGGVVVLWRLQRVIEAVYLGDNQYSLDTRLDAWKIMFQIIGINPALGLGPGNYYWYTPLFPIRGYAVTFNSHNNYIDLLAQVGILGLACFLCFAWLIGINTWRLRGAARPGFERAYVCSAFGGLIGTLASGMLGDWFLPFVYNIGIAGMRSSLPGWVFLGGVLALGRIIRSREEASSSRSLEARALAHA